MWNNPDSSLYIIWRYFLFRNVQHHGIGWLLNSFRLHDIILNYIQISSLSFNIHLALVSWLCGICNKSIRENQINIWRKNRKQSNRVAREKTLPKLKIHFSPSTRFLFNMWVIRDYRKYGWFYSRKTTSAFYFFLRCLVQSASILSKCIMESKCHYFRK